MATAKKGQFTLFVAFALVLVVLIVLGYYILQQKNAGEEIAKIESIADARQAVEACITDTIEDNLYALGYNGGYVNKNSYTFSSFNTSYELLTVEEMQHNLKSSLERNVDNCGDILEATPYELILNGRPAVTVSFADTAIINVDSLGIIQQRDTAEIRETVTEMEKEFQVNIPQIHAIVEQIFDPEGILIESYDGYAINIFVSPEYSEELLEVHHEESGFVFRMTRIV